MIIHSLPPVIDRHSKLLILGSMPGAVSLRTGQYYGHPRNHFWPIVYALFGGGAPDPEYDHRLVFALKHRIALWDSIAACEREGSLDADIRNAVPNDIPALLHRFPAIETIACNGSKSFAEFRKHHGSAPEVLSRRLVKLPSSSPVPTAEYRSFQGRLEAWEIIREGLEEAE